MDSLNHMWKYILIFLSSLVLSLVFVPISGFFARKFKILDIPDDNLKKHKKAIPYLGGVGIFLAFFITLFWQQIVFIHTIKGLGGLLLGSSLIFALGLVDDIKKLSVPLKLIVQALSAVVLVIFGIKIEFLRNDFLNILVTIFWVVGITNAFNLLDVMDGLSSGVAVIASITLFIVGIEGGKLFSPLAALALSGATLGFLVYNKPPAKIFMGDTGALFIGFMLAALSLKESFSKTNNLAVLAPLVILGVPIFDTLFVMWMRWKQGKPVYYGSPDHFPLRLERAGVPVPKILAIVYSAGIVLAVAGYYSTKTTFAGAAALYALLIALAILVAKKLSKIK